MKCDKKIIKEVLEVGKITSVVPEILLKADGSTTKLIEILVK
jgi:hypothetical protein